MKKIIDMNQKLSIETATKAAALFGYIVVVLSLFLVLIGADVGNIHELPQTDYHKFVEASK